MLQRNAFILLVCIGLTAVRSEAVHAQGLLGAILRDAIAGTEKSRSRQAPTERNPVMWYQTDFQLRDGEWVVDHQRYSDSYDSITECRTDLKRTARSVLEAIALKPLAGQYLGDTALVVKEGVDPERPVWNLVVLTCGGGKVSSGSPLDAATLEAMAAVGTPATTLFAHATDFVRKTEGSFPPPPTAAAMAEAQRQDKFLAQVVLYEPNGIMQRGAGDQLFDTANECDRYTTAKLKTAVSQAPGGASILGKTVFFPDDASGYAWFGCIRLKDLDTPAFEKYVDVKMTLDRARAMQRFPNFALPSPDTSKKPSKQIRF